MAKLTPFNELKTETGKQKRLDRYAKEREERGTVECLARLVRPAKIKEIKDGNRQASVRLAIYNKEKKDSDFITASKFIEKGKDALEEFYASLTKGQLVSVEYKQTNGYNNIYSMMDRSYADNRKSKKVEVKQEEPDLEA